MSIAISASYILASFLFILSIRGLHTPEASRKGNITGIIAMLTAITASLFLPEIDEYTWIIGAIIIGAVIGAVMAVKVKMTSLPQMVALLNGFGGLASVLVAFAEINNNGHAYISSTLSLIIGGIAFSGSMIAFGKLQGIISGKPIVFFLQRAVNLLSLLGIFALSFLFWTTGSIEYFYWLTALVLIFGFLAVIPIGGADMPVVISFLNSYTGWAAVFVGFSLSNVLLIIVGAMVGASGAILSYIMSKAMNRSLANVLLGGFGNASSKSDTRDNTDKIARAGSPEDAAFLMRNAEKVIIVPGYGMAVAQAQHIVQEMAENLINEGVEVKFAIHPVAGRMPGHMNVLLAEANVPYELVFELEEINREFSTADVAYVIGANDVTNPLAKTDRSSPIYGMPILDVEKAKTVFFVKRSLASGYSGVDNPLFYRENTTMLYGDAKKVTEQIVAALEI